VVTPDFVDDDDALPTSTADVQDEYNPVDEGDEDSVAMAQTYGVDMGVAGFGLGFGGILSSSALQRGFDSNCILFIYSADFLHLQAY
jgi:hypothetical protein